MKRRPRRKIPADKLFVVTRNTEKIDFRKKFTFIYFDWWFELLALPTLLFCYLLAASCALYCSLRVTGLRHLRVLRRQGCITVSNHCHYFDTVFAAFVLFPRRLYVSVAQRNYEVPIVRRILRLVRAFPIPADPRGFAMVAGPVGEALRRGHHVHFLPEGDLVYLSQEVFRFKSGAFRLAYLHQAPILPMVFVLTPRRLFGREQSPHWPRVRLVVGEPLSPPPRREDGALPREAIREMMEKVAGWMEATIASYHEQRVPQTTPGAPVDQGC
jgi:1-acyl-sn-glycerol-3-phosphate acyltransferase